MFGCKALSNLYLQEVEKINDFKDVFFNENCIVTITFRGASENASAVYNDFPGM